MVWTLSYWPIVEQDNDSAPTQRLPPVEAADLVSYLVLETSFVTAQQFKAHKSMETYNQFVSGWDKDVSAQTICIWQG